MKGSGIWTMDRSCDRKKLLEPLLDKGLRFAFRSTGERTVNNWRGRLRSVTGCLRLAATPSGARG